jgi:hypothetical protein
MSIKLVILAAALITAGPVLAATGGSSGGGSSSASAGSAGGAHGGGGAGGGHGGGGGGAHGGGGSAHGGGGAFGGRAAAASAAHANHGSAHAGFTRGAQTVAGKHSGVEQATVRVASTSKTSDTKHHRPNCREPRSDIATSPFSYDGCTRLAIGAGDPNFWMPCHGSPVKKSI